MTAMPRLQTFTEHQLVARIGRRLMGRGPHAPPVTVDIGDDTAVLPALTGSMRFASDMLIEGVHFRLPPGRAGRASASGRVAPRWVGWKALACNVSDIAAMGGLPRYAVVSLGVPRTTPVRVVDELIEGLAACARRFQVAVVGGDTVRAPRVVVDVAILGTVPAGRAVLRSGAKVGDQLFVTGRLGGSLGSHRHARFVPRLREAQWLARHLPVHAMIDLSDGLASDLWQLARASGVALRVHERDIPVAPAAGGVWHALTDGEDFELLFAVPPRAARRVPGTIGHCPVTRIGSVVRRGAQVELVRRNGRRTPVSPAGFRHFG